MILVTTVFLTLQDRKVNTLAIDMYAGIFSVLIAGFVESPASNIETTVGSFTSSYFFDRLDRLSQTY
jgi:hypothetical protein